MIEYIFFVFVIPFVTAALATYLIYKKAYAKGMVRGYSKAIMDMTHETKE